MVSKTTVLTVAIFLGFATVGGMAAIALLALNGTQVPGALENLTGVALGALSMTLGSARSTLSSGEIPVTTTATPGSTEPVTTTTVTGPADPGGHVTIVGTVDDRPGAGAGMGGQLG